MEKTYIYINALIHLLTILLYLESGSRGKCLLGVDIPTWKLK